MKGVSASVPALMLALVLLSACGRDGRVIPKKQMAAVYADMFAADQWLRDHPGARKNADTTFFYDPVFKKYGYTRKDYDASVRYYVKKPDKYAQIILSSSAILEKEIRRMEKIKSRQEFVRDMNSGIFGYARKDFDGPAMWDVTLADSAMIQIKENAERRDSIRTDSLETAGQFVGIEPASD